MKVEPLQPIAFTILNAVAFSGLSRSRLYELIGRQEIPSFQVGGRRMILRSALEAYFANLSGEGSQ